MRKNIAQLDRPNQVRGLGIKCFVGFRNDRGTIPEVKKMTGATKKGAAEASRTSGTRRDESVTIATEVKGVQIIIRGQNTGGYLYMRKEKPLVPISDTLQSGT